ncbi:unnamed protein product [Euphydryas editha]|uniref:Uncharacterized protein n=1 Tax=Euphydryas editha TaxID=104508 RepID=A0AAU9U1C4_EUPED|nr:unnamed protein product [Euphydryas editha]
MRQRSPTSAARTARGRAPAGVGRRLVRGSRRRTNGRSAATRRRGVTGAGRSRPPLAACTWPDLAPWQRAAPGPRTPRSPLARYSRKESSPDSQSRRSSALFCRLFDNFALRNIKDRLLVDKYESLQRELR